MNSYSSCVPFVFPPLFSPIVKAGEALSCMPIVVMTGSESEEDRLRSQFLQVDGYVTKPVDGDKFRRIIQELKRFWHTDLILPGIALTP